MSDTNRDIVERLREVPQREVSDIIHDDMSFAEEAADEIERLRHDNKVLRERDHYLYVTGQRAPRVGEKDNGWGLVGTFDEDGVRTA